MLQQVVALWILAIGPNITVVHNIVHTWQQTDRGQLSLENVHAVGVETPTPVQSNLHSAPAPPRIMTRSAGHRA